MREMDDLRISKRVSNANFYLITFIVGFIAFFLIREIIMLVLMIVFEIRDPGFAVSFASLLEQGNFLGFTPNMWTTLNLSQFLGNLLLTIPLVIILWKVIVRDFKLFKTELWHNLGVIGFGFILMLFGQNLLSRIYQYFGIVDESANQELIMYALEADSSIFILLSVVILAPLLEELLFRQLFFGLLEEKFKFPKVVALLISAAVFAALHAYDIFFFQYFFMALILAGSYSLFKNNIIIPIGIHFLNNAVILLYVFDIIG